MQEYLKELKEQLERFLGFSLEEWSLEEALQEAERNGAMIFWGYIQMKLKDLKIKL